MPSASPSIEVDQVTFSWDLDKGLMQVWGQPVACWWIETTMAGFMLGLQRTVGTERFNLALEGAGRESTAGEWDHIITPMPSVEEPVVGVIDGERAAMIMESLLTRITEVRAALVIIDLTGADALDAAAADGLLRLIGATRLLGARSVVSGISPNMAATLVASDARLSDVRAYGTLEAALHDGVRSMQK